MILHNQKSRFYSRTRRGTTLIEAAIGLWFTCTVIVGCIDFSVATMRTEALNHIAHRVARVAIIHGKYAPSTYNGGSWGPTSVSTTMSGANAIATTANKYSCGLKPSAVNITVTWPAGNNNPGSAVVVETSTTWSPVFLGKLGYSLVTLRGKSYQIIQH